MPPKRQSINQMLAAMPTKPKPWRVGEVPDTWWHEENTIAGDGAPNARQREFIEDTSSDIIIYGGSVGGGKTQGSIWKATKYARDYPGIKIAIGRRYFTEVIPMVFDPAHAYWERLRSKYGWRFKVVSGVAYRKVIFCTGSEIEFRAFDDPAKFQGLNIHIAFWDEIGQADEDSIFELQKRVRGSLMADEGTIGYPTQLWGTSNYATGYVNDKIVAPAKRGEISETFPGAKFVPCLTSDQMVRYERIAKATGQANYLDRLVNAGAATMESLTVDGWTSPEGTVWRPLEEVGENRDIIDAFEFVRDFGVIQPSDTVYFGLDHGINHPSTVIVGVFRTTKSGQKILIVFDEWSEPLGARPHTYLAEVISRKVMPARKHRGWADSRMKHGKLQSTVDTSMAPIAQIYAAGINIDKAPACKAFQKALSIHAVAEALSNHVILFVREGTEKLREQWAGYMKAGSLAKPGEDPCLPAGDAKNDHMLDAFRYLVSGLVEARELILSERVMHGMSEAAPRSMTPAEMHADRIQSKEAKEMPFIGNSANRNRNSPLAPWETLESRPGIVTKFPQEARGRGRERGRFPFQ